MPRPAPYFSDVLDHVRRVQAMVDGLREVLTSVFEFSNLLEQQRTGVITRQLAAWAAILAVPTAIAGIYGMNFETYAGASHAIRLFRHARRSASSASGSTTGSGAPAGSDQPLQGLIWPAPAGERRCETRRNRPRRR